MQLLQLPIDFELSDSVRRLAIKHGADSALAICFRLWCDWGRCGKEWRALSLPIADGAPGIDWKNEPLARIIEQYCQWKGEEGALMADLLTCGLIESHRQGSIDGLILVGFWSFNEHLSPNHKTMQQRGGAIKAKNQKLRDMDRLAQQQVRLFEVHKQGELSLVSGDKATDEEMEAATRLIMKLDVACDLPQRRTEDYTSAMIASAISVVRLHTPDEIDLIIRFLIKNSDNPALVRDPAAILSAFGDQLRKAKGQ